MLKLLGGSPTAIPLDSLYSALAQGVEDGAENNTPCLYSSRTYETVKYYALDKHTSPPDVLIMSKIAWDKLPPVAQKIIIQAAKESLDFEIRLWEKTANANLEAIKKSGVIVYEVDKEPFRKAVEPIYKQYEGTKIGKLIEEIKTLEQPSRNPNIISM